MKDIVKIQRPLAGADQMMFYNKDHSVVYMEPSTDNIRKLFKGGELKVYYYFHMVGTKISLDGRAPEQDW